MNSRHIACKLCRDSKVRRPGEQPACAKCRRVGEQCVYVPAQRSTKANLNETIEALQKRLNETENMILNMRACSSHAAAMTPSAYGVDWFSISNFSAVATPSLSAPPATPVADINSFFFGQFGQQNLLYQQPDNRPSSGSQLLQLPAGQVETAEKSGSVEVYAGLNFQAAFPSDFNGEAPEHRQMSGQEVSRRSTSSPRVISTSTPSSLHDSNDGSGTESINDPAGAAVINTLSSYCSSVVRRECQVVGIAKTVADYQMMVNLETRVRELAEVAQDKHDEPFRNLLGALEGACNTTIANRLAGLEADLQKQRQDHAAFFEKSYNTCKLLSEQAEERP
ncbi:hypothetical protein C7999DRAFT_41240 [Corynascus novoguineensis]|uniref:Zn(2)-C6 fungal-type domain-containing protein n=1 Tax=Corynascus novoguineensis TaxID=1126955 RepID=A0AAN7HJ05_9PEZI|nr:hypothetical protein C7999DRAFT_41240 [Corynascus novoguineensis]